MYSAFGLVAVVALVCASPALAQTVSVPATSSAITTITIEGYDVDFTLPTAAKAGCLVCHGDADLTRLKDERVVSYYIDPALVGDSAHASVQCTGCHLDFAFTLPHETLTNDWQATSKSACKNCHQEQFLDYGRSVHRFEAERVATTVDEDIEKPLCGDCHGSHEIQTLTDSPEGQAALRADGYDVCGSCHQEYWDNYLDYYHGAAYKRGAVDAPACWDCHGGHEVLPSTDKNSTVNERHLLETCGECHTGANEAYLEYAKMIHTREDISDGVILKTAYQWLRDTFLGLFGG